MLEAIAVMIVLILCSLGAVELCRWIIFKVLVPDEGKKFIVLLPVRGQEESLEYEVRCAQSRAKWFRGEGRVVCLNYGMEEETERLCQMLCMEKEGVCLMSPEELCEELAGELQLESE